MQNRKNFPRLAERRAVREEGLSAIIVEQNPAKILGITDQAVILERGIIVHSGPAEALANDRATLDRYLAVGRNGKSSAG